MKSLGLYIHIPFCKARCAYCDFVSSVRGYDFQVKYLDALMREIEQRSANFNSHLVDTVFFGGGTPSLLANGAISQILACIKDNFRLSKQAEITIEANPDSIDREKVISYIESGVNRVSIGIQSMQNEELIASGRIHSSEQAVKAVLLLRDCGIKNLSCDVIMGLPKQTEDSLNNTIDRLIELDAFTHFSVYGLRVEEGTALFEGGYKTDDDTQAQMYLQSVERLRQNGFERYEISNLARQGFECRHNLKYWSFEEYLGLGAGAHSFYGSVRGFNTLDIDSYIEDFGYKQIDSDKTALMHEFIMLSLRLREGLSLKKLRDLFNYDILKEREQAINQLLSLNIVKISNDTLKICDGYVYAQNQILLKLL